MFVKWKGAVDMLAAERRKRIIELIDKNEAVRVTELSLLFCVTEETIRRDLEKLEKEKKIIRQHGGAIKHTQENSEVHFSEREIFRVREKKKIAELAATLINEGDQIILDASTTAWHLANCLPNIPLIVITNSVQIVTLLANKDQIETISTGGRYSHRSHSFIGPLAERAISTYYVNKAFISCTGAHITNGLSDSSEVQAILKKSMISSSDEIILMMDSSKAKKQAFAQFAKIEKINYIVSDTKLDTRFKNQAEKLGVRILIAK